MSRKIFIHIPKNAGMTIRKSPALKELITPAGPKVHRSADYSNAVREKMKSLGDHHGLEHARWVDLSAKAQERECFAVIRNPWDRVVSRYFFAKKVIEVEKKTDPSYADISSFEAFLEERYRWGISEYMWHRAIRGWYPAHDYVTDKEGNIRCDMMRFENLNEDLCQYFNLKEMSRARNVTNLNKGTYKDLYTPQTIQLVADWYQRDIELWGYDFDTGPTRNYWNA